MADDVERNFESDLQYSKFSIYLDESNFGSLNILMVYVRHCGISLKCIVEEFLFSK